MKLLAPIWIFWNIIFYAGLGIFTLVKPLEIADTIGYKLLNPTGIAELKAAYGGLLIALAAIMFISYLKLPLQVTLAFIALIYLGYASGRSIGIISNGAWDSTTILFVSIEISSFIISTLLFLFHRQTRFGI